jgi:hypothetical protein
LDNQVLGWGVLDLFSEKEDLNTGNFKVPLYYPPADPETNLHRFHEQSRRVPLCNTYMRIESDLMPENSQKLKYTKPGGPGSLPQVRNIGTLN